MDASQGGILGYASVQGGDDFVQIGDPAGINGLEKSLNFLGQGHSVQRRLGNIPAYVLVLEFVGEFGVAFNIRYFYSRSGSLFKRGDQFSRHVAIPGLNVKCLSR